MRARDFFLVRNPGPAAPGQEMLAWHSQLGGTAVSWRSESLRCVLWGGPSATTRVIGADGIYQATCLLAGAPMGFSSIDADTIQQRLLDSYLAEGISALRHLDGSFSGVLIDERTGVILLFTDRFGFRKAFVARRDGAIYASSRAVVLGRGLGLDVDEAGAVCCTLIGHTIGARSVFAGCEALMPATALDLCSGRRHQYWDIRPFIAERRRDRTSTDRLCESFNAACRTIVEAQRWPALNLTGGFDTRAVLSGALTCRRPLVGVTAGSLENTAVQAIVAATGIAHHLVAFDPQSAPGDDDRFALLTDGECDSTGGGAALRHWQRLAGLVPSGCLHGGVGEVWRAYYYQHHWPSLQYIRRHPVDALVERLILERKHLLPALAAPLRRSAMEMVRAEVKSLWRTVEGPDGLAAIDAFYLLERQRGLTRVSSAADLWNPVYSPFASSDFAEYALGYLGPQNRGDALHRDIISRNAPRLAALPRYPAGDCRPRPRWRASATRVAETMKHVVGRGVGPALRHRLRSDSVAAYPYRMAVETSRAQSAYDLGYVRRRLERSSHGLGSITAVMAAFGSTT